MYHTRKTFALSIIWTRQEKERLKVKCGQQKSETLTFLPPPPPVWTTERLSKNSEIFLSRLLQNLSLLPGIGTATLSPAQPLPSSWKSRLP